MEYRGTPLSEDDRKRFRKDIIAFESIEEQSEAEKELEGGMIDPKINYRGTIFYQTNFNRLL